MWHLVSLPLDLSCFQLKSLSLTLFRDGPDTSSPQLGVFSGNTALESAYSTSPNVLIRFHSDFSTGGFFILNFHGTNTHSHMHIFCIIHIPQDVCFILELDVFEYTDMRKETSGFLCQNVVLYLNEYKSGLSGCISSVNNRSLFKNWYSIAICEYSAFSTHF